MSFGCAHILTEFNDSARSERVTGYSEVGNFLVYFQVADDYAATQEKHRKSRLFDAISDLLNSRRNLSTDWLNPPRTTYLTREI